MWSRTKNEGARSVGCVAAGVVALPRFSDRFSASIDGLSDPQRYRALLLQHEEIRPGHCVRDHRHATHHQGHDRA